MKIPDYTPQPWPEGTKAPTIEEYLDWFLEQSREFQLWAMQQYHDDMEAAAECFKQNHDDLYQETIYLHQRIRELQFAKQ